MNRYKEELKKHILLSCMSWIMAFSSVCMIHYAANLDMVGTAVMEFFGPILGLYYVRAQVNAKSDFDALWYAVQSGLGFMLGSIAAISVLNG